LNTTVKTKELGIATKFFPDDLEEALRKSTGKKYDIISGEKKSTGDAINSYFHKSSAGIHQWKTATAQFSGLRD